MSFRDELTQLINRHSKENKSATPDFILAQYLENCLRAFGEAVGRRAAWYGGAKECPGGPEQDRQKAEKEKEGCP